MLRRTSLFALALAVALVPAAAADTKERTGTRINLFAGGLQFFPANEPFYIQHGWAISQGNPDDPQAIGRFGFSLAVDDVERREDFVDKFHVEHPTIGRQQVRNWVFNFADGLTGTHWFRGHWFGPCEQLVNGGQTTGPCDNPVEIRTAIAPLNVAVVFVP